MIILNIIYFCFSNQISIERIFDACIAKGYDFYKFGIEKKTWLKHKQKNWNHCLQRVDCKRTDMLLRFLFLFILVVEKSVETAAANDELKDGKASCHLNIC